MTILELLQELYDTLPDIACQGKCWNSCGPIDMSDAERERIVELGYTIPVFTEEAAERWANDEPLHCPALNPQTHRCEVYDARPMICRLWGVGDSMQCPRGCKPTKVLSDGETYQFLLTSLAVGGHPRHAEGMTEDFLAILRDPEIGPLMARFIRGERQLVDRISELLAARR